MDRRGTVGGQFGLEPTRGRRFPAREHWLGRADYDTILRE